VGVDILRKYVPLPKDGFQVCYKNHSMYILGAPGVKISFRVLVLTKVGREISSIINFAENIERAKAFANLIPKTNLIKICYGRPDEQDLDKTEILWEENRVSDEQKASAG